MKFIHTANLYGDLDALKRLGKAVEGRSDLDAIVISGNTLGACLDKEQIGRLNKAFSYITSNVRVNGKIPFETLLERILEADAPDEVKKAVKEYTELVKRFDEAANSTYRELAAIFGGFNKNVLTVPGDLDSPAYFDMLKEFDIHEKVVNISGNGLKFAGYGSAPNPSRLLISPLERRIPYSGDELRGFLDGIEEDPDIIVTCIPARGLVDCTEDGRHVGSSDVLASVRGIAPRILLCGYTPSARNSVKEKYQDTIIVNPGRLGRLPLSEERKGRGEVYEIEMSQGHISSIKPYKVADGEFQRDETVNSYSI